MKRLFGFNMSDEQAPNVGDVLEVTKPGPNAAAPVAKGVRVAVTGEGRLDCSEFDAWKDPSNHEFKIFQRGSGTGRRFGFLTCDGTFPQVGSVLEVEAPSGSFPATHVEKGMLVTVTGEGTLSCPQVGAWRNAADHIFKAASMAQAVTPEPVGVVTSAKYFLFDGEKYPRVVPAAEAVEPMDPIDEDAMAAMINNLSDRLFQLDPPVKAIPENLDGFIKTGRFSNPTPLSMRERWEVRVVEGYEPLFNELINALEQSQAGKGKERHANDLPFVRQPILELSRMCGPGGPAQQVMKKTQEALGMFERGQHERAVAELHGAMVYAAATIIAIREKAGHDPK